MAADKTPTKDDVKDEAKKEPAFQGVEVVVKRAGFYANSLRPIGSKFRFTGNKLPSWVVPVEEAKDLKPEKAKPLNGDTKPADAQAAVKAKAAGAGNG